MVGSLPLRLAVLFAAICPLLSSCTPVRSPVAVDYRGPAAAVAVGSGWPGFSGRTYPPGVVVRPAPERGDAGREVEVGPFAEPFHAGFGGRPEVFRLHNSGSLAVDWVVCECEHMARHFLPIQGSGYAARESVHAMSPVRSWFVYRRRLGPGERQDCAVWLQEDGWLGCYQVGGRPKVISASSGTGPVPGGRHLEAVPYFGPDDLLPGGQVSGEALARFRQALGEAADETGRIRLLAMLVAAAQAKSPDGLPAVVQPEFVQVLVEAIRPEKALLPAAPQGVLGLPEPEEDWLPRTSRAYARAALLSLVPPRLLAGHRQAMAGLAGGAPGRVELELMAKARAVGALPLLGKAGLPRVWGDGLLRLAVLGALGDVLCERQLLDAFAVEQDPARKIGMVHYLGVLGTKAALRLVAEELRSTVEIRDPKVGLRRMRFEAVDALRISHPDNRLCYTPLLRTDADWEALEQFCTREFGAEFKGVRPPPPAGGAVKTIIYEP